MVNLLCRKDCWFRVAQSASMGPNQPWEPSNPEGHSWTPSLATTKPQQAMPATEMPLQHPTSQLHLQVCGRVPQEDVLMLVKWSHFSW